MAEKVVYHSGDAGAARAILWQWTGIVDADAASLRPMACPVRVALPHSNEFLFTELKPRHRRKQALGEGTVDVI
jgi:hypothetical protein